MPVRPRHCNGQHTHARHATDRGAVGKASRRGPEPGDDSSSAPLSQILGGGAGGGQASFLARARCGHSSERSVRFDFQSSIIPHSRRLRASARCLRAAAPASRDAERRFRGSGSDRPATEAHRVAESGDDRDALCVRRRVATRGPLAVRSMARFGQACPDLGNGLAPNVEVVLGAHPDLVILYASQDNRPAAARFRAAGVEHARLSRPITSPISVAPFRSLGAILRDSARARAVSDSVFRTLGSRARSNCQSPAADSVLAHLGRTADHDWRPAAS